MTDLRSKTRDSEDSGFDLFEIVSSTMSRRPEIHQQLVEDQEILDLICQQL